MRTVYNPLILCRTSRIDTCYLNSNIFKSVYEGKQKIDQRKLDLLEKSKPVVNEIEVLYSKCQDNKLLNIKRNIHNNAYKKAEKILSQIDKYDISEKIKFLIDEDYEIEKLEKYNEELYEQALLESRKLLRKAFLEESDLSESLVHFNKKIYIKLEKYLNTPSEEHKNDLRKLDYTLMKILTRASKKTSPFSTLTLVARADEKGVEKIDDLEKGLEVNHAIMMRGFFNSIKNDSATLKAINFKLGNIRIGKSEINIVGQRDDFQSNKIYGNKDFFSKINMNNLIKNIISNKEGDYFNYDDFSKELIKNNIEEFKIVALLKQYINIGLIIPCVGLREDGNFLGNLKYSFNKYYKNIEKLEAIIKTIDELERSLKEFEQASLVERRKLFDQIQKLLLQYAQQTEIEVDISKNVIYEDSYSNSVKKIDFDLNVKNQLAVYQKLSLLFDPNIRMLLEISEQLKDITEPRAIDYKIVEKFFDVSKEISHYWGDTKYMSKECKNKNIHILDEIKNDFINQLNRIEKKDEIDITELINETVERIPAKIFSDLETSTTFFFQVLSDDDIVINCSYAGMQKFKARFLRYFKSFIDSDERYKDYIDEVFECNNYTEILECFGFNGGAHEQVLKSSCKLNLGTEQFVEKEFRNKRIEFDGIRVVYNTESEKINFIDKNGDKVKFAYMTSLVSLMLPGYISFITGLFSIGRMGVSLSDLFLGDIKPRIRFENLILDRRRWLLRGLNDINIEEKINDYEYYIFINEYFSKRNMPREFYLKYKKDYAHMDLKADMTQFKPQYISLENPSLVKLFKKLISNKELTNYYIEEAKPNNFKRVEEYSLEVTNMYGDDDERA